MARHRNLKHLDDDDYEYDFDAIGHSVEEDSCMSPRSQAQFLYRRSSDHRGALSDFVQVLEEEEDEDEESLATAESSLPTAAKNDQAKPQRMADSRHVPGPSAEAADNRQQANLGGRAKVVSPRCSSSATVGFTPPPAQSKSQFEMKNGPEAIKREKSPFPTSPKSSKSAHRKIHKRPSGGKQLVNLVVVGHVDAGKSTLMGHLLYKLGDVNQRTMHKYKQESQKMGKSTFAFAWVLDEGSEERSRGVTMDIAKRSFQTANRHIVLLDAPGHRDFIPNMISGVTQADAAVLVVNAARGEFETGFDLGGQTREHTVLVRSLGISQLLVAVNKMDSVDWSKRRYEELMGSLKQFLKQTGFSGARFVPVSGLIGDNLTTRVEDDHPLGNWYSGPSLLEMIDGFEPPVRSVEKPLRVAITDVFRGQSGALSVAGKVLTGAVETGDKVLLLPSGETAQVKNAQGDEGMDGTCYAGDQCLLTLSGIADGNGLCPGQVLCHPDSPLTPTSRFNVRLVLFAIQIPLTPGFPTALHTHNSCETATITKLLSQLSKTTGEVVSKRPRCLGKNSSGIVEVRTEHPICVENYAEMKELGRVTFRASGETIGAGIVVDKL